MAGADLGASLGLKLAAIAARSREVSLARTTPALAAQVAKVADAYGKQRAQEMTGRLTGWLEEHASNSPLPSGISKLFGSLLGPGSFLGNYVIGNAIGFGVGTALAATLTPWFNDLTQAAWRANPSSILTPSELAVAVLKGHMDQPAAEAEALSSGVTPERFQVLVDTAGNPPGIEALLMLWRRGQLSDADLERAVRQSNVRVEWTDTIKDLGVQWPTWTEFLEAYLEGQVDEREARELYARAGGDPELFDLLYATRGQAPTPVQLADMANRGLIPWTGTGRDAVTFEQGFLEGPWRNKWLDTFRKAAEYRPPPRTVVAMLRNQAVTVERATELLLDYGVSQEDAAAMLAEAANAATETDRELTKAEVLALYEGRHLDEPQAEALLRDIGYGPDQVAMLLALAESRRLRTYRDRLVSTIRARYVGRKIEETDAVTALDGLGISFDARDQLLDLWAQERAATTADLTLAQWQAAVRRAIVDEAGFREEMERRGYSTFEVDVLWALTAPAA